MVLVEDLDTGCLGDVGRRDNARAFGLNAQALWPFDFHTDRDALEVQHDVGDVFTHARYG